MDSALATDSHTGFASDVLNFLRNKKPPQRGLWGFLYWGSGVDLLSRTVKCNIIGAEAFHGPVRDGKGWFHLAMDTRRKGCVTTSACCIDRQARFGRSKVFGMVAVMYSLHAVHVTGLQPDVLA